MYQPAIPFDGLTGWRFLQDTYDQQMKAFQDSSQVQRDTDYFRESIGSITSAEELVADRQLLSVALGAFGLQDDIDNKYYIQKVLEEGTTNEESFANKLGDDRYAEFSAAFGFGPGETRGSAEPGFADAIIADYERISFEVAVGEQSETLRIAMNAERVFEGMAEDESSAESRWFEILGDPPMRDLFETLFSLPSEFSQIDIDQQQQILQDRSMSVFGVDDPAAFNNPELQDTLLSRYTAMTQLDNTSGTSSGAIALSLLQR